MSDRPTREPSGIAGQLPPELALGECPNCGRQGFISSTSRVLNVLNPLRAIALGGPCSWCGHVLPDGPAHGVGAFEEAGVALRRLWGELLREVIEPITLPMIRWLTRKLGGTKKE